MGNQASISNGGIYLNNKTRNLYICSLWFAKRLDRIGLNFFSTFFFLFNINFFYRQRLALQLVPYKSLFYIKFCLTIFFLGVPSQAAEATTGDQSWG